MITVYWFDLVLGAALCGGIGAAAGGAALILMAHWEHVRRSRRP